MRSGNPEAKGSEPPRKLRCAIYTRKSTEEGLEQEFSSLDAQREAAEAFIQSQRREGWVALSAHYDDGGFTGANMERPALKKLLEAVESGAVDCVVVYKVDRLSRSLLDFQASDSSGEPGVRTTVFLFVLAALPEGSEISRIRHTSLTRPAYAGTLGRRSVILQLFITGIIIT